jgi:hypothetical protein
MERMTKNPRFHNSGWPWRLWLLEQALRPSFPRPRGPRGRGPRGAWCGPVGSAGAAWGGRNRLS